VQSAPVQRGGACGLVPFCHAAPVALSGWFKSLLGMVIRRDPAILAPWRYGCVTSVGMFGRGHSEWGLHPTGNPSPGGGGIAWNQRRGRGASSRARWLKLTVVFDHDVIDGAPATRFVRRLVELIESGNGLCEEESHAEQATLNRTGKNETYPHITSGID